MGTKSSNPALAELESRSRRVGPNVGEGWMTGGARDMLRIAAIANFDIKELVTRLAWIGTQAKRKGSLINAATVERVMGEMYDEWNAKHKEEQARRWNRRQRIAARGSAK